MDKVLEEMEWLFLYLFIVFFFVSVDCFYEYLKVYRNYVGENCISGELNG